jgi:hypothetical protein
MVQVRNNERTFATVLFFDRPYSSEQGNAIGSARDRDDCMSPAPVPRFPDGSETTFEYGRYALKRIVPTVFSNRRRWTFSGHGSAFIIANSHWHLALNSARAPFH